MTSLTVLQNCICPATPESRSIRVHFGEYDAVDWDATGMGMGERRYGCCVVCAELFPPCETAAEDRIIVRLVLDLLN